MAQAVFVQDGNEIDYTPSSDVGAGAVVVQGTLIGVAKRPIAANTLGALSIRGLFDVVKAAVAFTAGAAVYWDADGDPVGGAEGAGAATTENAGNTFMGLAVGAAGETEATVRVALAPEPPGVPVYGQALRFTQHGLESVVSIVLDAAAVDAGNTPPTTLRAGLVLGKVTETGRYKQYDPEASDGTETARLVLAEEVDLLEDGSPVNRPGIGLFRGDIIAAKTIGMDEDAKAALRHCAFDEEL